jgi:hypothetical protein
VLGLGIIFFLLRYIVDCHLLLNLYKREIESSGSLIHNACLKAIYCLLFFQLCIMLKFVGSEKYVTATLLGCMLIFTAFVTFLYNDRFLRPQLFKDEEFRMDVQVLNNWAHLYTQHLADRPEVASEPRRRPGRPRRCHSKGGGQNAVGRVLAQTRPT